MHGQYKLQRARRLHSCVLTSALCSHLHPSQPFAHQSLASSFLSLSKSTLWLVLRDCGRHCGWPHASALLGDFAKPSHHEWGIFPYLFRLSCKSSSGSEPVLILQRNPVRFLALTLDGSQLPVIPALGIWWPLLTFRQLFSLARTHTHKLKKMFFKETEVLHQFWV